MHPSYPWLVNVDFALFLLSDVRRSNLSDSYGETPTGLPALPQWGVRQKPRPCGDRNLHHRSLPTRTPRVDRESIVPCYLKVVCVCRGLRLVVCSGQPKLALRHGQETVLNEFVQHGLEAAGVRFLELFALGPVESVAANEFPR